MACEACRVGAAAVLLASGSAGLVAACMASIQVHLCTAQPTRRGQGWRHMHCSGHRTQVVQLCSAGLGNCRACFMPACSAQLAEAGLR